MTRRQLNRTRRRYNALRRSHLGWTLKQWDRVMAEIEANEHDIDDWLRYIARDYHL